MIEGATGETETEGEDLAATIAAVTVTVVPGRDLRVVSIHDLRHGQDQSRDQSRRRGSRRRATEAEAARVRETIEDELKITLH